MRKKEAFFSIMFNSVLFLLCASFIPCVINVILNSLGKPELPLWLKILSVVIMGFCILAICILLIIEKKHLHNSKEKNN